jgi:cytochrome c-type biogenesis protein CcmH
VTLRVARLYALVRLAAAVGLLALMLLPGLARADAVDASVRRIGLQLQCPVCEGENVADSPSGLAGDMRAVIRTKVIVGEPDQQILDEFVASYGDGILTEPPKRGISLGVWLGPVIGVLLGALLLGVLFSTWRRMPGRATGATAAASFDPDAAEEFHRFREELGR